MKERKFKLTNFAVDNVKTVYFFTVILIFMGMSAYRSTPKEMAPEIVFPYFAVTTIYPGTSPADMENLVTRPIEKQLKGINGIKHINSNSIQDFSMIFVEFETNVDNNEAYQDVKEAVDKAKSELPANLLAAPDIMKIEMSEFPILNINLSGDLGLVKLKEYADNLQDEIEGLEEITRVDIVGALNREIQINIDLYKMQATGLSFTQIENSIVMENMTISSGQIEIGGMRRTIRIVGEFETVDEIKNIFLKPGIYLKDIAEVVDDYADRESYARLGGQDVVTLNVIKKGGKNLIIAVDKINVLLEEFKKKSSDNLIVTPTGDQSTMTRNNISNLFNTIILGFLVVTLILMFFMGVNNALFVAVAIPLSMLIAFIFVPVFGFTMNMVVLMAFILVLGIVVDNSIVVVENIYRHFMTTPDLPIHTASKRAVGEVALPVFSGTLTTMAPFFPLIFWPGIMGKFMSYIPVTLIITLSASMLVAYVMNPVFAVSFMKYKKDEHKKTTNRKKLFITLIILIVFASILYFIKIYFLANIISLGVFIYLLIKYVLTPLIKRFQSSFIPLLLQGYKKALSFFIKGKRPYVVIFSTFLLLIFTFILLGIRTPKVILLAEGDPSNIQIYIRMPAGTDIEVTNSVTKMVEEKVFNIIGRDNPDVESIVANVAIGAGQSMFERSTQPNLGKVTVSFVEYKYRTVRTTNEYVDKLREQITGIPGAEVVVDVQQMGPPTGKPISIEISGDNIDKLIKLSNRLLTYIDSLNIRGIEELKSDIEIHNPELIVNIDREKANKMGISTAYIGMILRTALYGKGISKFREGEDEYDIRIRLDEKYRKNLDLLMNLNLVLPGGSQGSMKKIPISSVASVYYSTSYGGIIRKDNKRIITLSSNVLAGYNANEIVHTVKRSLDNFDLEEGYEIKFGGEQDLQAEAMDFLSMALFLAIAIIFMILVAQFNSIGKPIIILIQVIFSITGVLLGLIIFNIDISVVLTGMGIIAVAGIVVKNAIILIDYTDILIAREGNAVEAIIKAGATRLTPVILTAASTILGLLPLAIGMNINFVTLFTEFQPDIYFGGDTAAFWRPLALTIIFGLTFATFLTLIVVPSMYKLFYVKEGK